MKRGRFARCEVRRWKIAAQVRMIGKGVRGVGTGADPGGGPGPRGGRRPPGAGSFSLTHRGGWSSIRRQKRRLAAPPLVSLETLTKPNKPHEVRWRDTEGGGYPWSVENPGPGGSRDGRPPPASNRRGRWTGAPRRRGAGVRRRAGAEGAGGAVCPTVLQKSVLAHTTHSTIQIEQRMSGLQKTEAQEH